MVHLFSIITVVLTISSVLASDQTKTSSESHQPSNQGLEGATNDDAAFNAYVRAVASYANRTRSLNDNKPGSANVRPAFKNAQGDNPLHHFLHWTYTLTGIIVVVCGTTAVCKRLWSWSKSSQILPPALALAIPGTAAVLASASDLGEDFLLHFFLIGSLARVGGCIVILVAAVAVLRRLVSQSLPILALSLTAAIFFPTTALAQRGYGTSYRNAARAHYRNDCAPGKIIGRPTLPVQLVAVLKSDDVVPEPPAIDAEQNQKDLHVPDTVESSRPPWRFTKNVTLSLRGDNDLPYDSFRGCGLFVIASLLDGAGYKPDLEEIVKLDPDKDGTTAHQLISYLEIFFEITSQGSATTEQLISHLEIGSPAIVAVRATGSHWCLVTGCRTDSSGSPVSWQLVDNGTVHGEMPHDEFARIWDCSEHFRNYAIFISPKADKKQFQKTVQLPTLTLPKKVKHNHNGVSLLASLFHASGCDIDQTAFDHISRALDPDGDGTTPSEWAEYLQPFFDVKHQSESSAVELAQYLDAGLPAFVVLTINGWPRHWVVVTGYHSDELGNPVSWSVLDISRKAELSHEQFLAAWNAHEAYQNYALFVTPDQAKRQPTFPKH